MRTRDRPVFLRRALDDVLAQDYPGWSLVVVNDGGEQSLVDALVDARAAAFAGRAQVIHHQRSLGMEAASNTGVRHADSEFVAIHDDDDTWHPSFLTRTLRHLRDSAEVAVAAQTEIVWERLEPDGSIVEEGREPFHPGSQDLLLFDLLRFNHAVPISMLYRRSVHDEVGYFDERLRAVGDWEFILRVTRQFTVGFLGGEPLAYWHQRREVGGPLSNSVIVHQREHVRFDRLVRDEALRSYVRDHGIGGLLYLSKFLDERAAELHGRLDAMSAGLEQVIGLLGETNERLARLEQYRSSTPWRRDQRRMPWRRIVVSPDSAFDHSDG
jgi:glycosyltransferase involved in cell wall biosynthesis